MSAAVLRVVLATHNAGKIRELAEPLSAFGVEVLGLDSFPEIGEIEETGSTFRENALLKAREVSRLTGLISVADDSGLEVDALNGRPGVYSARYSDNEESLPGESRDARNIRKLLAEMADVPKNKRTCRFISNIACVRQDGQELVVEGVWKGLILEKPRGEMGFGYDPVFFDLNSGKSAAELSTEEKNAVSHRGEALRQLYEKWPFFIGAWVLGSQNSEKVVCPLCGVEAVCSEGPGQDMCNISCLNPNCMNPQTNWQPKNAAIQKWAKFESCFKDWRKPGTE